MNNVIAFLTCRSFRDGADRWFAAGLEDADQDLFDQHYDHCSACRRWFDQWEPYFELFDDVAQDVTIPWNLQETIRQTLDSRYLIARDITRQILKRLFRPIQFASILFIVGLVSAFLSQPSQDGDSVYPLGHVMVVQARSFYPPKVPIVLEWSMEPPVTADFNLVLECFMGRRFALFDPEHASNSIVGHLVGTQGYRQFFMSWCSMINHAIGRVQCRGERGCKLELHAS